MISHSRMARNGGLSGTRPRRALVIGGSMSGLFAAILLRQAGGEADIFERVDGALDRPRRRHRDARADAKQPVLTPAVYAAAERHHTPEAVMSEIAVLDFLNE
jgi:2-polyprenyl-6-methoxyphenol hydroxylase-like FAD-dependent oxidoreductase